MKTYKINEAKEMIGQPIPRIIGTLTKVYDRKTGEGKFGPWSLQNGEIQDETGVVSIVFSGLPDMTDKRGQEITFRSNQSKKGLTGIVMEENTYNGVTKPQLKVSASALILDGEEIEKTHGGTVEKVEPSSRLPAQITEQMEACRKPFNGQDGVQAARHRLMQKANLYRLCYAGAKHSANGNGLDPQYVKDVATTLFISMEKEGYSDKMPNDHPVAEKTTPVTVIRHNEPVENDLHEQEQPF